MAKLLFDYCNCAFKGKNFDMTQIPPMIVTANQFSSLTNGYSVPTPTCTASGGNFIPTVGTIVSGSSTMTVGSIGLGGLTLVSSGVYKADLNVDFNNSVRKMKSIKANVMFSINMTGGVPTARPFAGCGAISPSGVISHGVISGGGALISSSNIASSSRLSTGVYVITFTSPMPNANYTIVATAEDSGVIVAQVAVATATDFTIQVQRKTGGGSTVPVDPTRLHFIALP